jgi:hypothetical protein
MNGLATTLKSPQHATSGPRAFALHLGEMLVAMMLGMLVLGGAVEGVLALNGASLADASASLSAAVMALTMTVPMVWWMKLRGHPARHNVEMAGSMIVPTAIVVAFHLLGAVPATGVMLIQHVTMIPAMVGVMLWRNEHYSR